MSLVPLLYSGLPLPGQWLLQHTVLVAEETILFQHFPELRKLAGQGEASGSAPCPATQVCGVFSEKILPPRAGGQLRAAAIDCDVWGSWDLTGSLL